MIQIVCFLLAFACVILYYLMVLLIMLDRVKLCVTTSSSCFICLSLKIILLAFVF